MATVHSSCPSQFSPQPAVCAFPCCLWEWSAAKQESHWRQFGNHIELQGSDLDTWIEGKSEREEFGQYQTLGLALIDKCRFQYIGKGIDTETVDYGERPLFHHLVGLFSPTVHIKRDGGRSNLVPRLLAMSGRASALLSEHLLSLLRSRSGAVPKPAEGRGKSLPLDSVGRCLWMLLRNGLESQPTPDCAGPRRSLLAGLWPVRSLLLRLSVRAGVPPREFQQVRRASQRELSLRRVVQYHLLPVALLKQPLRVSQRHFPLEHHFLRLAGGEEKPGRG